jgi:riboflavin synthase
MFSGIVAFQSSVVKRSKKDGLLTLAIRRPKGLRPRVSESVAVNGVCSTVVGITKDLLTFTYMPETLRRTNIGILQKGDCVNLEAPLTFGDRVSGHFVTGHVDTTGTVSAIAADGDARRFHINIPKHDMRYIIPKGSITIDGVGLTIIKKDRGSFTVSLTPYTLSHTNLHSKQEGDAVNIEYDSIAKYLNEIISQREEENRPTLRRHRAKPL